jgi:hypothetical protein
MNSLVNKIENITLDGMNSRDDNKILDYFMEHKT